ncbi:hypothetical protein [Mesorhizobium kowhaii]|uniref:UrcA family protein n=1 Tax=Mesorhizobium kowhaii TaxID=1300272 RepID=A0A2W7BV12_9HYPH|nr:hypothetical protein [Mesorhizobium kowhaii]PZV34740.1 hypothetical protein B5V02_31085 [Mesorhizobium kowhaii]
MNIKSTCLGAAFALSVLSGDVFAGALDVIDPINTQSFYTGSIKEHVQTNPIMRARFRAALKTLPHAKRMAMMRECQDAAMTKPYAEFCADLNALAGS